MNVLLPIFRFYINSSIHVAFAVLAMTIVTVFEFNLKVPSHLYGLVFFGTITGYNFVKYAKIAGLHHRSLTQNLRAIQLFSGICVVVLLGLLFYTDFLVLLVLGIFGALTFFYAVPLGKDTLRTLTGTKIVIVALVWAGVTVLVPLVGANMSFTATSWLTFFQRVLLVIVLTLPFEIRDLKYDTLQLKTIPQQFGVYKTKIMGGVLLLLVVVAEFFKNEFLALHFYAILVMCFLSLYGLLVAKKNPPKYYASFWIEGIPIVWCVLWWSLSHFLA